MSDPHRSGQHFAQTLRTEAQSLLGNVGEGARRVSVLEWVDVPLRFVDRHVALAEIVGEVDPLARLLERGGVLDVEPARRAAVGSDRSESCDARLGVGRRLVELGGEIALEGRVAALLAG
jgi:hypothetical protein